MADSDYRCCNNCNEVYVTCSISRNAGSGLCWDCYYNLLELIRTGGEEKKK